MAISNAEYIGVIMEKLLTQKQVSSIVSFSRSYIYTMMSEDKFPKPIKFGRYNRWIQSEIEKWVEELKTV